MDAFNRAEYTLRRSNTGRVITIAKNDHVGSGPSVNLAALDLDIYMRNPVVMWEHARGEKMPVAKTTRIWRDGDGAIVAEFDFLKGDKVAERVENAWNQGVINAASIRWAKTDDGRDYLQEWSFVGIPADTDALRRSFGSLLNSHLTFSRTQDTPPAPEVDEVDKAEVQAMIDAAFEKSRSADDGDAKLRSDITKLVTDTITEKEQAAENQRKADEAAETLRTEMEAKANKRANLMYMCRSILGDQVDLKGMNERTMIATALNQTVTDDMSDDYLLGRLEAKVEARSESSSYFPQDAFGGQPQQTQPQGGGQPQSHEPVSVPTGQRAGGGGGGGLVGVSPLDLIQMRNAQGGSSSRTVN